MAAQRLSNRLLGRLRLASQGLLGPGLASVPEAVRWMTATQAQDLPAALWAIGLRVPGAGLGEVRAALDNGSVVRSWPMRGTLHLVAPEDLRWMLDLTADRLARLVAGRHRELGITWSDIEQCRAVALERVAGGPVARSDLFTAFDDAGQPTQGQRGIHILGSLCRHAWLVPGPLDGNRQLLAAFGDWIPVSRNLGGQEAIAEFALRYFRSHGPATLRDFAWWTGLPLTEVRAAFERVRGELAELEFGGSSYWMSAEAASLVHDGVPGQRSVLLLPGFDEFVLGYTDRSLVLAPEHANRIVPGGNGVFKKTIVAGGAVVGTWAGPGKGRSAAVVPEPFDEAKPLSPAATAAFNKAAARYLAFLAG